MKLRSLLVGGLVLMALRCASDEENPGGDDDGDAGSGADAGDNTGGTGGGTGGSGGSNTGGAPGGESSGGTSGSATGGTSGSGGTDTGGDGGQSGAGDSGAGAGGEDSGRGTVTGRVATLQGQAIEGAVISIGSATASTDADGRFEIPDVAAEYDLVMIQSADFYARVVHGLTTRNVNLQGVAEWDPNGASVRGMLSGAGIPLATGHYAAAGFVGPNGATALNSGIAVDRNDSSYGINTSWNGPASVAGTLYALAWEEDSMRHPIAYDGFGSKPFTVSNAGVFGNRDGSVPATNIALSAVGEHTVLSRLALPTGYSLSEPVFFWVDLVIVDRYDMTPGADYSIVFPTGVPLDKFASTRAVRDVPPDRQESIEAWYQIEDSTTALDVAPPAAAALLLPVDLAAGVDENTMFRWTPPANSISTLTLDLGAWVVEVTGPESSGTIPDLSSYGIAPTPGAEAGWRVTSTLYVDTTDEWSESQGDQGAYYAARERVGWAFSAIRFYTIAD